MKVDKSFRKEEDNKTEKKKILLSEEEENKIYSESYSFAKNLVFYLVSNPASLAKIVRLNNRESFGSEKSEKFNNLMEAFSQSFFDNIAEDEPFELNQMKFLSELLNVKSKIEFK